MKFGDVPEGDNNDATGFACVFFIQLTCVFNTVKTERKMRRKEEGYVIWYLKFYFRFH